MQTITLSRAEYNREKKIIAPKCMQRMKLQEPTHNHLLEPLQISGDQIRIHLEALKNKDRKQIIENRNYQQILHQYQTRIQDLRANCTTKEDEIRKLKNQKHFDEKKINDLEKINLDLKTNMAKIQYQYKGSLDFMQSQYAAQKSEYLERIAFLEEECKKYKDAYKKLVDDARLVYESRVQQFGTENDVFTKVRQQYRKKFQLDISFYREQHDLLKNQINQEENKDFDKVKFYQQQHLKLYQKIQAQQTEFGFVLLKNENLVKQKDNQIKVLQTKIEDMIKNFQKARQRFIHEKDLMMKVIQEKQTNLRLNVQKLIVQKSEKQSQINDYQIQINNLKYQNQNLDHQIVELSNKLQSVEVNKKHAIENLQQMITKIRTDNEQNMEKKTQKLKSSYQQKISHLKNQIKQKNEEVDSLNEKIQKLEKQIKQKDQKLKNNENINLNNSSDLSSKKSQIESLKIQIQKLKGQNQLLKQNKEKKEIANKSVRQNIQQINRVSQEFQSYAQNISDRSMSQKSNIRVPLIIQYNHGFVQENKEKLQLSRSHNVFSEIGESYSYYTENPSQSNQKKIEEMKKTIENQGEKLLQYQQLKKELYNTAFQLKNQNLLKDHFLRQRQKKIQWYQNYLKNVKDQAIQKYQQLKNQFKEVQTKLQDQNNQNILKLQKASNQNQHLTLKLTNLQNQFTYLESQHKKNLQFNAKIKEITTKNQHNQSQKMILIKDQKIEALETANKNFQKLCLTLRQSNQKFYKQFVTLRNQNLQLSQSNKKCDKEITELKRSLQQKDSQKKKIQQKLDSKYKKLEEAQKQIIEYKDIKLKLDKKLLQIQKQNKKLVQKLSEYEVYSLELKRLNIHPINQVQQILEDNNTLKAEIQKLKQDIKFQTKRKNELEIDLQKTKKRHEKQKQDLKKQIQNNMDSHYKTVLQLEIQKKQDQFQQNNKRLLDKINLLQQQNKKKNKQIQNAYIKIQQSNGSLKHESQRIHQLTEKIQMYKNKYQTANFNLITANKNLQQKQKLIIQMRGQIKYHRLKEKTSHNNKINNQQFQPKGFFTERLHKELGPAQLIRNFRNKVDTIYQEKDKIYKTLNEQERKIVDQIDKINRFVDLSTKGCLYQIEMLLKENKKQKKVNEKLRNFMKIIMNENNYKLKRYSSIMQGFKENLGQMHKFGKQLDQNNIKWQTIFGQITELEEDQPNHETRFELNQNQYFRNNQSQDERYWGQFEAQFEHKQQPSQVAEQKILSVIQSSVSVQEETVRKENIRQAPQTLPKPIKHNYRYANIEKEE